MGEVIAQRENSSCAAGRLDVDMSDGDVEFYVVNGCRIAAQITIKSDKFKIDDSFYLYEKTSSKKYHLGKLSFDEAFYDDIVVTSQFTDALFKNSLDRMQEHIRSVLAGYALASEVGGQLMDAFDFNIYKSCIETPDPNCDRQLVIDREYVSTGIMGLFDAIALKGIRAMINQRDALIEQYKQSDMETPFSSNPLKLYSDKTLPYFRDQKSKLFSLSLYTLLTTSNKINLDDLHNGSSLTRREDFIPRWITSKFAVQGKLSMRLFESKYTKHHVYGFGQYSPYGVIKVKNVSSDPIVSNSSFDSNHTIVAGLGIGKYTGVANFEIGAIVHSQDKLKISASDDTEAQDVGTYRKLSPVFTISFDAHFDKNWRTAKRLNKAITFELSFIINNVKYEFAPPYKFPIPKRLVVFKIGAKLGYL